MSGAEDVEAIHAAVLDYVEGWFDGDGDRMQRALHPELVKRSRDARSGIRTLSARHMIDATVEGRAAARMPTIGGSRSTSSTSAATSRV